MGHFTYKDSLDDTSPLEQGDILCRSEKLNAIIQEVHPHYLKDDYLYFIVLTQSCDLVPRKRGLCKAPYITIAAIRPLELLISRLVRKKQTTKLEQKANIVHESHKVGISEFIERLFNNNEPEYFYLHEDSSIGLPSCVSFLRLSVAIKSDLHYQACVEARVSSLAETFKSKLGWLVGNMYSRVGTEDWVPETLSHENFKEMIKGTLEGSVIFLDDKKYRLLKDTFTDEEIEREDQQEIIRRIQKLEVKSKKEQLIDSLQKILEKRGVIPDPDDIKKFLNFVKNDRAVNSILK
ncbi:MAG: hypothetical protein BA869_04955 [Desulfuromonadales bacterium C00003107]|jgi:hypothetical protein|nr:MAG: hypothetical protein BA869_04955 [Desulfuromonadales bacterium C00003107]